VIHRAWRDPGGLIRVEVGRFFNREIWELGEDPRKLLPELPELPVASGQGCSSMIHRAGEIREG
jgi:hypothetical protein